MDNGKCTITFIPDNISYEAQKGTLLADAAAHAGIKIDRHCGGAGVCGKCRVREITPGLLEPLTETEKKFFSPKEIQDGIRLSCCAAISGSGTVEVIDIVSSSGHQILKGFSKDTPITWQPDKGGYGIAVDIGTTTVVCYLADLSRHKELDSYSFLNPQVSFGDDVISRIAFSSQPEGLTRLQNAITKEMDCAIGVLAEKNHLAKEVITEIVIAGNTVMEHLFVGVSPEAIGRSPYKPEFLTHEPIKAQSIGLNISTDGIVKMLPNVAGYVGADIVAGVAALGMDKEPKMRLLVDIGTNNEIVIGSEKGMFCCATAAGPALEGARILYGMRASTGAIEKVSLGENGLEYKTIGGAQAKGLCGSGLVDAIALLVKNKIINKSGRMQKHEECLDPRIKSRLGTDANGMVRFLLTDTENPVYLTQKDIREVQLAVGAIKVGIEVMLENQGINLEEVDEVLLAGAFGNNIDIESAIVVGLLPNVEHHKIIGVRNSSGYGAFLSLASADFCASAQTAMEKMQYVELSTLPDFQKRFVSAMLF